MLDDGVVGREAATPLIEFGRTARGVTASLASAICSSDRESAQRSRFRSSLAAAAWLVTSKFREDVWNELVLGEALERRVSVASLGNVAKRRKCNPMNARRSRAKSGAKREARATKFPREATGALPTHPALKKSANPSITTSNGDAPVTETKLA